MDRDASPEAVEACVERARKIYEWQGAADRLQLSSPEDYGRLSAPMQINIEKWLITQSK